MNQGFLKKAELLSPELIYNTLIAKQVVEVYKTGCSYDSKIIGNVECLSSMPLKKGDKVCLDFGQHCVGHISFEARTVGNPPDNPAHLKIKFGETICEIVEPFENYNGNISSSWLQEEYLFIDVLPDKVNMPRRYAFRYIEFEVLDTSHQFQLVIENVSCRTVTSADMKKITELECNDTELIKIDEVAINTLKDCMQEVFEDGPKRDRRLWIGDLRLQALTNYVTFQNYDLVKRCLYLFAAVPLESGKTGGCLYIKPSVIVDTAINLFDYSLFFISCLYDYYMATNDMQTLEELWEIAYRQIELAEQSLDERSVVTDHPDNWWWCFIDWHKDLNKQAAAQAVYIFVSKQAEQLADILKDEDKRLYISRLIEKLEKAAVQYLWDDDNEFFVSGEMRQISWASQVWFAIAGIFSKEKTKKLLMSLKEKSPEIRMMTPYMHHCYIEALIAADMKSEAEAHIKKYWGGMVKAGADCFWEVYDMENPDLSAYGDRIINSYCHAWSCTPSYFIRKYFSGKQEG